MEYHDLVIIGGGPAGLAAADAAREAGAEDILLLERDVRLGGILNQCIHSGFGLHTFREELTGPEYAARYLRRVRDVPCRLRAMVTDLGPDRTVTYVSRDEGVVRLQAGAVVLAMGCRERPRGALGLPGTRPAGIYTAGTAQRLMNLEGRRVGEKAVILGSGDIGLIMARRMTLEGMEVKLVAELMPYSGGLRRNIVQCLDDFGIPLKLSHTVARIHGRSRVEAVTVARVGADRRVVPGTEETIPCDTLLLSCGLLPENELAKAAGIALDPVTGGAMVDARLETSAPGIFACGNALHVHDLVDYVSEEAARAGRNAAAYLRGGGAAGPAVRLRAGAGVRYTVPQRLDVARMEASVAVRFRVDGVYRGRRLGVYCGGRQVQSVKKRIMTPGEMETLTLTRESLRDCPAAGEILLCVEE